MTIAPDRPAVAPGPTGAHSAAPPPPPAAAPADLPRRTGTRSADDVLCLLGAGAGSLALVWLLHTRLLPLSGALGFAVAWYAAFLLLYVALLAQSHGRLDVVDRTVGVLVRSAGLLVVGALALVIGFVAVEGAQAVRWNLFTETLGGVGVTDPITRGGVLHAIVGTLQQITIAVVITVPLGIGAAVYLNEVKGPLTRPLRTLVEAMSALPSVVAGLFVFASVILLLGLPKSGFAASLALSVMMLPIIARSAEVVLRLVPSGLREASYALGASQWRTVLGVVLPTARSGLTTAVILGVARGIGETSPVLLTAGYTAELNLDPFEANQVSLPLVVFNLVRQPDDAAIARGFGAALTLLTLVLVLFVAARVAGSRRPGGRSRRPAAPAPAASAPAPAPAATTPEP